MRGRGGEIKARQGKLQTPEPSDNHCLYIKKPTERGSYGWKGREEKRRRTPSEKFIRATKLKTISGSAQMRQFQLNWAKSLDSQSVGLSRNASGGNRKRRRRRRENGGSIGWYDATTSRATAEMEFLRWGETVSSASQRVEGGTEMVSKMCFVSSFSFSGRARWQGRTEALKVLGEGLTWNPRH